MDAISTFFSPLLAKDIVQNKVEKFEGANKKCELNFSDLNGTAGFRS
jgi:hypothetical protein